MLSGESSKTVALRLSRKCSIDNVPTTTKILRERCSNQARATWRVVALIDAAAASRRGDRKGRKPPRRDERNVGFPPVLIGLVAAKEDFSSRAD